MANLFFSRNTRVLLSDGTTVWEIPVLDGFSFSQATNASEITLNEMSASGGTTSRRGRQMFNDSYAPAEWSFSTYARPFKSVVDKTTGWDGNAIKTHAVEEALWAYLVSNPTFTPGGSSGDGAWTTSIANATSTCTIDFNDSNVSALGTFDLFFVMGEGTVANATHTVYKLEGAVVNSAGIDFDIDGISTINWSGFAKLISELDTPASNLPAVTINEAITSTNNFIRNRLTTLTATNVAFLTDTDGDGTPEAGENSPTAYTLTLTGGNLNFENNITFLTPETLGVVNQPIGHVTGTRTIGGAFTCYLSNATAGSMDLYEDLQEATTTITNDFNLVFDIGGATAPAMKVTIPSAHLEIPTHSIEDVISLETTFHALPTDLDTADEASIVYAGAAY
jgi:hypothetical protein